MRAILKHIHSPDILNLAEFIPEKVDNFSVFLQLMVGPIDNEGEESFDLVLCTPLWLIENRHTSDIIVGRHYLIVFEYDYQRIFTKLKQLIEDTSGKTWEDIALKIGRIGKWEFEDYQEFKG